MKNTIRFTNHLLFVLFFSIIGFGQTTTNQFVTSKGGFTINLPDQPNDRKEMEFAILEFDVIGEYISWKDTANFFASFENYSVQGKQKTLSVKDKLRILEEYKKANVAEMIKSGIKVTERNYSFGTSPAFEIRGELGGKFILRGFFIKERLIVLSVSEKSAENFDSHLKILDSFRILTKDEYIEVKIAENTPNPLPQSFSVNLPLTDTQEMNLKGKVKIVYEQYQVSQKSERKPWGDDYFDENGNLVKEISYIDGYPEIISVWGWIDNMRVSSENSIKYDPNEGPDKSGIITVIESSMIENETSKQIDNRFDVRHETKFDNKTRINEKNKFANNGTLFFSEKFSYPRNGREVLVLGNKKMFIHKRLELFNENKDIIETRYFDWKDRASDVLVYQYEFDDKNNWIVQREFEKVTNKRKTILKPTYIHYRKIIYYN